jgi:hypothetical protein
LPTHVPRDRIDVARWLLGYLGAGFDQCPKGKGNDQQLPHHAAPDATAVSPDVRSERSTPFGRDGNIRLAADPDRVLPARQSSLT